MRHIALLLCCLVAGSCGSDSSTSPTVQTCTDRTASNFGQVGACFYPPPLQAPNFQVSELFIDCVRGFCFSATGTLTNYGPGCANGVQVLIRWYGADGAVLLPNTPDVLMGASGGLSTYYFGANTSLGIISLAGFNDVRSAHTVYRPIITYNTVACR